MEKRRYRDVVNKSVTRQLTKKEILKNFLKKQNYMKNILEFKHFRFKKIYEEVINKDIPTGASREDVLQGIEKSLSEIEQLEKTALVEYTYEDLEKFLDDSGMPKVMLEYTKSVMKLMFNDEWRNFYRKTLYDIKNKVISGVDLDTLKDDPDVQKMGDELTNIMSRVLDKSKDELEELTQKFMGGAKKFKELKEEGEHNRPVDIDPYSEEDWGSKSEEEIARVAFGN